MHFLIVLFGMDLVCTTQYQKKHHLQCLICIFLVHIRWKLYAYFCWIKIERLHLLSLINKCIWFFIPININRCPFLGLNDALDYISVSVCLVLPVFLGPVLLIFISPFIQIQVTKDKDLKKLLKYRILHCKIYLGSNWLNEGRNFHAFIMHLKRKDQISFWTNILSSPFLMILEKRPTPKSAIFNLFGWVDLCKYLNQSLFV